MPLFEVETSSHIIITWAEDEQHATDVVHENYPKEPPLRITKRPRNTWVISKSALGITNKTDPLLDRAGLPVQGGRRQSACDSPLYAAHGHRLGARPEGHRIEHGHGLVNVRGR